MNRFNQPKDEKDERLQAFKDFSDEQVAKHGLTHAILDESGEVVLVSLFEWAFWFEKSPQRVIQQDYYREGEYKVSTIFTGLDMGYNPERPLWFETMVFGPEEEERMPVTGKLYWARPCLWTERCTTLTQALATHKAGQDWLEQYMKECDANPRKHQGPVLGSESETGSGGGASPLDD